jgi:hypothetical protein
MVATAVGLIALAVLVSFIFFTNRSFASITNYVNLDQATQLALDKMSQQIRQVNHLSAYTTNSLTFQDYDGVDLVYNYDPVAQTLSRSKAGVTNTLLIGCDYLKFNIYQRTPSNSTFVPWTTTSVTNTKVIELTWNCYRSIMAAKANTESMQSAMIVIRNR